MLSLSGLQAFPLILSLAGLTDSSPAAARTNANSPTAQPIGSNAARQAEQASEDETADVLFHPLGLALFLGALPYDLALAPPGYPSDPGDPKPNGDPPPSGSDPPPSGSQPPPPKSAPEPATLISGMLGAGLMGLVGWRRRKRKEHTVEWH